MKLVLTVILGYLLGSVSTGVVLSRLLTHSDIRRSGSGNAGTTNMLRVHGRSLALLTLLGDMLKGIVSVFIGYALVGGTMGKILGLTGAVLGHNFPLYFGFKGGKGIATSFGCLLFIFPLHTLGALVLFLILFLTTHYVSVGSIGAAIFLPTAVTITHWDQPIIWVSIWCIGLLAIARHHANIKRLIRHEENKIDFSVFKKKAK